MRFQHLTGLIAVLQLRGREMLFLIDILHICPVPDTQRDGSHLEEQLQDSSDLPAALHPALPLCQTHLEGAPTSPAVFAAQ